MNEEKYSQRFRRLAGDFYRLLIEYESLDGDADPTVVYDKFGCIKNDLTGFMDEIEAKILNRLIDARGIDQIIERERTARELEVDGDDESI